MRRRPIILLVFAATILTMLAWTQHRAAPRSTSAVENVRTFAKLYGYVRFFHPSDEAAELDWDRFAIHGVRQVRNAGDAAALRGVLQDLFRPIAPTVQIYAAADGPPEPLPHLLPADTSGLELVAWQHKGIGLGTSSAYESRRLNRVPDELDRPSFGVLVQSVDAGPYKGRALRMRAAARAEVDEPGSQLQLWMRVDKPGEMGFFDNMDDRPITSSEWNTYEITGTIDEDAQSLVFGAFLVGSGKGWVDDFQLEVRGDDGAWEDVPVSNADFEEGDPGSSVTGWSGNGRGYAFRTELERGAEASASIESVTDAPGIPGALFDRHPLPGEILHKPIGNGLSVALPLVLYSRDGQTLGPVDEASLEALHAALDAVDVDSLTASDEALRMADVAIAWNVLQHSYPYFDLVDADWDAALASTLQDALDDDGAEAFMRTMSRMITRLEDGHGYVGHPVMRDYASLPFVPDLIEGQLVVVATEVFGRAEVGDVLVSIDGVPALEYLAERVDLQSGSEGWRRWRVLRAFGYGPEGDEVRVALLRDGEEMELTLRRTYAGRLEEMRPNNVSEVEPGIFYVNLGRAEMSEISGQIDEISAAVGVIFDLRGYPNSNHDVLRHLTDRPLRSARWQIPQMLYPDHEDLVGYDTTGRWTLQPATPRIEGTVVFLTNERAISYSESVMGIVEHYRLGEIVGQPTAGTNGNVNRIQLPGEFTVVYTGMRVVKHDGSQHHLVGIQPTIPVDRTLAAVREGRDEYVEKAIEVIRSR